MLKTLAVANYRSINKLVVPLDRLNLVTGPNGSGKSNLYRALLAVLDPTDQQNQLRAAQGDLARVQAQFINAQANARRQQELFNRGVGAQAQLDVAQTDLKTTQATLDQAKASVNQAKDQLNYAELRTDHAGIVTAWNAEAGQVVSAWPGSSQIGRAHV